MNRSLYAARRRRNGIMLSLSLAATLLGLGWLVVILGVLLWEGFSGLSLSVFTEMTPPPGSAGGLLNPIMGSLLLTVIAVIIGTPIGMLAGTYMAEYGRFDRLTSVVRFINDILLTPTSPRPGPACRSSSSSLRSRHTRTGRSLPGPARSSLPSPCLRYRSSRGRFPRDRSHECCIGRHAHCRHAKRHSRSRRHRPAAGQGHDPRPQLLLWRDPCPHEHQPVALPGQGIGCH